MLLVTNFTEEQFKGTQYRNYNNFSIIILSCQEYISKIILTEFHNVTFDSSNVSFKAYNFPNYSCEK